MARRAVAGAVREQAPAARRTSASRAAVVTEGAPGTEVCWRVSRGQRVARMGLGCGDLSNEGATFAPSVCSPGLATDGPSRQGTAILQDAQGHEMPSGRLSRTLPFRRPLSAVDEEAFEVDRGCRRERLQLDEAGAAASRAVGAVACEFCDCALGGRWRRRRSVGVRIRSRAATAA
jgi:hypothetical protein